ncbi:ribonuclease P protein component [Candidatus Endomicrobiellum agilis]|uniref:ribonuclease P protein component n=1 Tax=Candidatus Endomicrobiellum agilis TaxID=3238957 RepID=UPI003582FF34|nr:ribonuclease P protein component [Endomicrobium sp.]MCA6085771.1 ribonuclease P protein component [Endomicrobium sp.]
MQTDDRKNSSGNLFPENSAGKKFSFTYFERLHIQKDFNKVFKNGLRLENKNIKVLVYKRNDGHIIRRLGLITPKKTGTAVVRNRTKRRLREMFRTNKHFFEPGLDLIFISKPETALLNYSSLKKVILDLLKSAELYNPE